ncbi:unnamed protein product [Lepeophtheirus salmonis]|uniref:(salmon louse) hypothetical protein n=1 Tax=Lepeophtheirus salmonis TaxID=72036 RepID=A0A7R8CBB7_LEPSM|nr:unnamed protein product [Lepeophtheirus salmonis]CAF2756731.1 unnamed protein product [Lepeophtheirus salmonis]
MVRDSKSLDVTTNNTTSIANTIKTTIITIKKVPSRKTPKNTNDFTNKSSNATENPKTKPTLSNLAIVTNRCNDWPTTSSHSDKATPFRPQTKQSKERRRDTFMDGNNYYYYTRYSYGPLFILDIRLTTHRIVVTTLLATTVGITQRPPICCGTTPISTLNQMWKRSL